MSVNLYGQKHTESETKRKIKEALLKKLLLMK